MCGGLCSGRLARCGRNIIYCSRLHLDANQYSEHLLTRSLTILFIACGILQLPLYPATYEELEMVLSTRALALAASLASLLFSTTITASPLEHEKRIDVESFGLNPHKRQDPGPGGGAVDPSGVEPEDEDTAQIAADGTGPLRSGTSIPLDSFVGLH